MPVLQLVPGDVPLTTPQRFSVNWTEVLAGLSEDSLNRKGEPGTTQETGGLFTFPGPTAVVQTGVLGVEKLSK